MTQTAVIILSLAVAFFCGRLYEVRFLQRRGNS